MFYQKNKNKKRARRIPVVPNLGNKLTQSQIRVAEIFTVGRESTIFMN